MIKDYSTPIAQELNIKEKQVDAVTQLLDDGATVPFIARYRKEATGSLDEVAVTSIRDRIKQLRELDKRREAVMASIKEQGKLTDTLKKKIEQAATMAVLEDLYLPYKPKKRTRASIAKEKGLEPLAEKIFAQTGVDPEKEAAKYVDGDKKVDSVDAALAGARDIMAEWINESSGIRAKLRELFHSKGIISSKVVKGKEQEAAKYKDYFEWAEPVRFAPSHRILASRRGEKESFLIMHIRPPDEDAIQIMEDEFIKGAGPDADQVRLALQDSYKRLLSLSLETEIRLEYKKKADEEAIKIFADNLRQLLMAPALGQKRILAVDPGYRTGCKVVCLDEQGKLLHHEAIFIADSEAKREKAAETIIGLCAKHKIEIVAVGNGTASREAEAFIRGLNLSGGKVPCIIVNESGASIYSASDAAREEFPDQDVTVRGAVSIGRRLMDPLAELIKIDPKSIGVGQYQYDVDQKLLKQSLSDVVVSCVNQVGVEINTASRQLLTHVSGVGSNLAQAIIDQRNSQGPFRSRDQLRDISGLGPKVFEQAAGFLRIGGAENPLDESAVHPESYPLIERITDDLGCETREIMRNEGLIKKIDWQKYATETIGWPTLMDIKEELAKPGRDPREPFQLFEYREGIETLDDLAPGMTLPGVVTNITAFGAFVDVGVHQDGLVHISEMADRYVKSPHEVVKVHEKVSVTVLSVDMERRRIALSMKKNK